MHAAGAPAFKTGSFEALHGQLGLRSYKVVIRLLYDILILRYQTSSLRESAEPLQPSLQFCLPAVSAKTFSRAAIKESQHGGHLSVCRWAHHLSAEGRRGPERCDASLGKRIPAQVHRGGTAPTINEREASSYQMVREMTIMSMLRAGESPDDHAEVECTAQVSGTPAD